MSDDQLFGNREKALEDSFFRERERQLLEKLRAENEAREARESLSAASGIKNEAALANAVELGVSPESLIAVSLIPLILVAWADRTMEPSEKEAVLNAASEQGIVSGSAAWALLESWLADRPADGLFDAWKGYIEALRGKMGADDLAHVKEAVIDRATAVAKAAGGLAGIGAVSGQEKDMLAKLEKAFG